MKPTCFKCKNSLGSFVSRDGVSKLYCEDCFSAFCARTVRDTLFGQCAVPSNNPIAVGVSGGENSLFLLHQLGLLSRQGAVRGGDGATTLTFLPFHLREDELVLPPLPVTTPDSPSAAAGIRAERIQATRVEMMKQFAKLQNGVEEQIDRWEWANEPVFEKGILRVFRYSDFLSSPELNFLQDVLHHPRISLTSREELYYRVRENMLILAARALNAEWYAAHKNASFSGWVHFARGDNAVNCCISALHAVVTGGGGPSIIQRAGFRSFTHRVVQLRPLRMLLPKEVVLFNRCHGISGCYTPALCTGTALPSFHRVLEEFVYQTAVLHRTMIFNVLTVVVRVDAEKLIPETAEVLQSTRGVEKMDKKRLVFAKAAHHHAFLSSHAPPACSALSSTATERGLHEVLCWVCGTPLPIKGSLSGDSMSKDRVVCIPCRECINDTFPERYNHLSNQWGELWWGLMHQADV